MKKQREYSLDLIRAAAALLVLSVHFFLNIGFYDTPLQGAGMLAATALRMACMACVPLFMLLTGYLCADRRWEKGYWRGLLPVAAVYLLASTVCLLFRALWLKEPMSLLGMVRRTLDFSGAPYSWYVEMYAGLFLLIPFLNAAWHALPRQGRKGLILALLALTALPSGVNLAAQIVPDWWMGFYPVSYYAVGAWLREHPITVKKRWLLLGWAAAAAAGGLVYFAMARGGLFSWAPINDWGSPLVMAEGVCLFALLRQLDGGRVPALARRFVGWVAKLALPIYLVSYVADQLVYPALRSAVPTVEGRLPWMPLMVAAVLLLSAAMAQPVDWAARALLRLAPRRSDAPREDAEHSGTRES